MKTTEKDNYILLENDNESITEFSSHITKHHKDYKDNNLVIDLLKYEDPDPEIVLAFLEISNLHRGSNKSFVIVNKAVSIDKIPDELIVVPTIREAEDMIQMDEIERDLGF